MVGTTLCEVCQAVVWDRGRRPAYCEVHQAPIEVDTVIDAIEMLAKVKVWGEFRSLFKSFPFVH